MPFDDLMAANRDYQATFRDRGLRGQAARGLAIVTCIDSRVDPLAMLGLKPGDAKIIRNAGARITEDALRSLVLAANFLNVTRICVVQHTDCALARKSDAEFREGIRANTGESAEDWRFLSMEDQESTVRQDIAVIEACRLLPAGLELAGFIFDVHTGALSPVESES
ncbi:MAG TPA: carbonic anhydrase [Acidimicrobiales bacterium]|nr:carbonic anhydrase [Acidimicrobiales bacterium]